MSPYLHFFRVILFVAGKYILCTVSGRYNAFSMRSAAND
jgi:hypothetical protein